MCTKQNRELSFLAFIEPLSVSGLFNFFFFNWKKLHVYRGKIKSRKDNQ